MAKKKNINSNGFEYVDLELPSGTLWAASNIGADKPSDSGLYFQWGDNKGYTVGQIEKEKKEFDWDDYKFTPKNADFTKYKANGDKLQLRDDAAHVYMGGNWHIPSPEQINELIENTTSYWTTNDGIRGMILISNKDTSKYIFIPSSGFAVNGEITLDGECGGVWGSVTDLENIEFAKYLCIDYHNARLSFSSRCIGSPIRGVIG